MRSGPRNEGAEATIQADERKPRSRAKTIACARVQTPSLSNRLETWLRTVLSLIRSRSAISAFASPSVISPSTSRSRGDSAAKAGSAVAAYALFAFGWGLVLVTTLLINHFDLFGLRQVWFALRGQDYRPLSFVEPGPYKLVRHPLYVGCSPSGRRRR
jgi:protein-S-isoprenylcysteine O-methyltransferase Ste14